MGFINLFHEHNLQSGLDAFHNTANAVLMDVRTPEEYMAGHIPKAVNIPLQSIDSHISIDKDIPLFVYCFSGARSAQAVRKLRDLGYSSVTNIGGIQSYRGEVEK